MRRVLVAMVASVLASMLLPGAAGAQEGEAQAGWWTPSPITAGPDTGDDELLVQGSPDPEQPLAYAAVTFPLLPGAVPVSLTLTVAPEAATTPNATLAVCPLTDSSFEPARGGAAADGPEYSCDTSVEAGPSSDGTTYEFALAALPAVGVVALAVVPTAPTDRVVLSAPDPSALTVDSGTGTGGGDMDWSDGGSGNDVVGGSGGSGPSSGSTFGATPAASSSFTVPAPGDGATFDTPSTPAPGITGQPGDGGVTAGGGTGPTGGQQLATQPLSSGEGGGGRSLAPFLFAGLALTAGALWGFAGQSTDAEEEAA
jgi:hypothetical protein